MASSDLSDAGGQEVRAVLSVTLAKASNADASGIIITGRIDRFRILGGYACDRRQRGGENRASNFVLKSQLQCIQLSKSKENMPHRRKSIHLIDHSASYLSDIPPVAVNSGLRAQLNLQYALRFGADTLGENANADSRSVLLQGRTWTTAVYACSGLSCLRWLFFRF